MMIREPKYYLELGEKLFRDLMVRFGAPTESQTRVPGKSCQPIKSSMYPGKQSYKKKGKKANTKGRKN